MPPVGSEDRCHRSSPELFDGVKSALGIHSPSKVFADEIGKWIPPGIGVGIEAEMPDLYKQMDDEMSALGKRNADSC